MSRRAEARALFQQRMEEGQTALKTSSAFRFLDDGARAVYMVAFGEGRFLRATNDTFEQLTSGLAEGYERAVDKGTIPALIMAWYVVGG
jgi:hypothetical protein